MTINETIWAPSAAQSDWDVGDTATIALNFVANTTSVHEINLREFPIAIFQLPPLFDDILNDYETGLLRCCTTQK